MRRSHLDPGAASIGINLTPLIDIVFILLIFFIVTASFVKEAGIDVDRPAAQTAARKEQGNIMIAISEDNQVWLDEHLVDRRRVRAHVERLHAENPEGTVVIVADRESRVGLMVEVMDQVRLAGVTKIAVAATPDP